MPLTNLADQFGAPATTYRAGDLRYFLIAGETSWLESLRILDSRRRTWAGRMVTFFVLGASHAFSIHHPDGQVTELLSCSDGFRKDRCLAEKAAAESFESSAIIHDMRYSFRLAHHSLQGNDALLGRYPNAEQMTVAYPGQPEFAAPVTRIGWLIEPRTLRLETLHTYPEECIGVRTESLIEIA